MKNFNTEGILEERENLTGEQLDDEIQLESTLRPQKLEYFLGQTKLKRKLRVFLKAAKFREEPLDHSLFHGPPGTGKTTLANIIANEMEVDIVTSSGQILEKAGDLAGILTSLEEGDVFFIDEIHRLNQTVEEYLYSAMEDHFLDIVINQGPSARTVRLNLEPFTLVGSTTRPGMLTSPLRSRFGIIERLHYYQPEELKLIVLRSARILDIEIEDDAAFEIARRSRGTPRIVNRLLRRVRDYAQVEGDGVIRLDITKYALKILDIDEAGLDDMDRSILKIIINNYKGGPVGIKTIAVALSEDVNTIEEMYEPYLVQQGFLMRTTRGRVATALAGKHLKINYNGLQIQKNELF
ncbi:MAG: Holliday junction branch migration DNA helicase RuvB [Candidatus Zixiibacteriota bacterium]